MLVVSMLLVIVIGAALALLDTSNRIAPAERERAHAIHDAQVGLSRMTRELRQAYQVVDKGPYFMDVRVNRLGRDRRVVYRCDVDHPSDADLRRCVRYEIAASGAQSPSEVIVDRVMNIPPPTGTPTAPVFEFVDKPAIGTTFVNAKVEVPAAGERQSGHQHRVALDDGFYMRNTDLGA
jgi:hypothetical protein